MHAKIELFDRIGNAEACLPGAERLAKTLLDAPVIGLALEAAQLQPMAPPSESLFPEPGGSEEDRVRMLELLVARLGPDNVLQALPQADYRPEVANTCATTGRFMGRR